MTTKAHPIASVVGGARDGWCTPQWVIDLILRVWPEGIACDPCWNPSSPVKAPRLYALGTAAMLGDGLQIGPWPERTYVNPPYSDPTEWIVRCAATPSCMAMVRCDPSVGWWAHVWSASSLAFFRRRVQFVAPPGVKASQNTGANVLALFNAPRSMVDRFRDVMVEVAHVID